MSIELAKKIGASFQDNFVYFDFQQLEAYDKALTKDDSVVIYVDAGHLREILNGNEMPIYASSEQDEQGRLEPLYLATPAIESQLAAEKEKVKRLREAMSIIEQQAFIIGVNECSRHAKNALADTKEKQ